MKGLVEIIEAAIRFPGFALVNIQSPCVTYGEESSQAKNHKEWATSLADMGHDVTDRLQAMNLAQAYGEKLYTGIFFRDPSPPPTYEQEVAARHEALAPRSADGRRGAPRASVLDAFFQRLTVE
jgi:2-oxoglutarate ferredoxin oxidoreductase subunit beta